MAPTFVKPSSEFSFRTRQQSWDKLKANPEEPLDFAIVGGGIVGAGLLRELTLRGVTNVCLFEKNDFASGTSSASSKLIHAGIRYLEQVWVNLKRARLKNAFINFRFVVQASRERRILGTLAPHLVKPKPIYFVLSASDPRSSFSVLSGVWLYYFIQLFQGQFFSPPTAKFTRRSIASALPDMDASRLKAAFTFWDSETDDARLVIETLQSANAFGGQALNYVELLGAEQIEGGQRITLQNRETGETIQKRVKKLINASGPFVDEVRRRQKGASPTLKPLLDRVEGCHINVAPPVSDHSYYVSASDNRLVFLLRRNEDGLLYTRIGTTERPLAEGDSSEASVATDAEVKYLRDLVTEYFPYAVINESTLISVDSGIRPLRAQGESSVFQKSREHDLIEENGVLHVVGVKLTDFRRVAAEVADTFHLPDTAAARETPLRPRVAPMVYTESTVAEIINKTMALHWEDYFFRRLGLLPQVEIRRDLEGVKKIFNEFADLREWNSDQRLEEWETCLKKRGVLRPGE